MFVIGKNELYRLLLDEKYENRLIIKYEEIKRKNKLM